LNADCQESKVDSRFKRKRVVMARRIFLSEMDRSFDLEFWDKVGVEGRWSAAWEMTAEVQKIRGKDGDQPRLQRSVQSIQRARS